MLTVLIPCRNESGNIERLFSVLTNFSTEFEYIFIEGGSQDNTFEVLQEFISSSTIKDAKLIQQSGRGKFNAVYEGAQVSKYENLAIWDSDLTIDEIDQELLISVYLLQPSRAKFVTANRLNPQIHDSAMRPLNRLGNHFFSFMNKAVTKVNIPDVLSGSKIFPRYLLMDENICQRAMELDPFGDLFLIARASYHQLHVISINCEYKPRDYGETNIPRWSGGWALVKFLIHLNNHKCHKFKEL